MGGSWCTDLGQLVVYWPWVARGVLTLGGSWCTDLGWLVVYWHWADHRVLTLGGSWCTDLGWLVVYWHWADHRVLTLGGSWCTDLGRFVVYWPWVARGVLTLGGSWCTDLGRFVVYWPWVVRGVLTLGGSSCTDLGWLVVYWPWVARGSSWARRMPWGPVCSWCRAARSASVGRRGSPSCCRHPPSHPLQVQHKVLNVLTIHPGGRHSIRFSSIQRSHWLYCGEILTFLSVSASSSTVALLRRVCLPSSVVLSPSVASVSISRYAICSSFNIFVNSRFSPRGSTYRTSRKLYHFALRSSILKLLGLNRF